MSSLDDDPRGYEVAKAEKARYQKLTYIWSIASTLALFLSIGIYKGVLQPRFDHAEVDGIRVAQTSRGPLFVANEAVGRGGTRVDAYRTSLIDARTLTRLARTVDGDAGRMLGQARGGGPLWFAQRGRYSDRGSFSAWDPLTLRELFTSDALFARHLPELASGVHSFSFDSKREALAIVNNLNHTVLIDGAFQAHTEAEYDALPVPQGFGARPPPRRKGRLPEPLPSLELLRTGDIELRDGTTGDLPSLIDPPGVLISARDSLASDAPISLIRLNDQGELVFRRSFPGSNGFLKVYVLGDELIAVARAGEGEGNDWLHALDAQTGAEKRSYRF